MGTAGSGGERARAGASTSARPAECAIWGILNVTPDSFSDGGLYQACDAALRQAERMVAEGADVLDVGGESTRPRGATYGAGATFVSLEEERQRVLPIVEALAKRGYRVSVDTKKPEVARAALNAGAAIVNDVSAYADDALLRAVADAGASLVRMHNRGMGEVAPPQTTYHDLVRDVCRELDHELARAVHAGIPRERLFADPGLGFAKTSEQSLRLLGALRALGELHAPLLVGASRKSFLATFAPCRDGSEQGPRDRLGASIAAAVFAAENGASAVRVHDVGATRQALQLSAALADADPLSGALPVKFPMIARSAP